MKKVYIKPEAAVEEICLTSVLMVSGYINNNAGSGWSGD